MIDAQDKSNAEKVRGILRGAFFTGSYLVNPDAANDIDVVVGSSAWAMHVAESGFYAESYQDVDGLKFEIQDNGGSDDYGRDEEGPFGHEVESNWRCGGVNILVVADIFIAAYKAASYRLEADPRKYPDREDRVKMHQEMKDVIRNMLHDAANEGLPF